MPPTDPLPAAKAEEPDAQAANEQAIGHLVLSFGKKYFLHALLCLALTGWSGDHFILRPASPSPAAVSSVTPEFVDHVNKKLDSFDLKLDKLSEVLLRVELRQEAQYALLSTSDQARVSKLYRQSLAAIDVKQELNGGHP